MKEYKILTIFPDMAEVMLDKGVISRAVKEGLISIKGIDLREYAEGRHSKTDDYQYGGGVGLVMKPEPLVKAIRALKEESDTHVILLDPRGERFTQKTAERLANYDSLTFVCGRYEGVDERVRDLVVDEALSLGDFVLTGGELAAFTMIDAVARLVPGVLGDETSAEEESFTTGRLEYPHYTRPEVFEGLKVPEVLLSGNHAEIIRWRAEASLRETERYRPDLLPFDELSEGLRKEAYEASRTRAGRKLKLAVALLHYPMRDKQGAVVTTSLTNMDLHDISRSASTYGADRYFVVTPLLAQQEIGGRVIKHWTEGFGAGYNPNRKEAFFRTEFCGSLLEAIESCEILWGEKPLVVATTAKPERADISASLLGDLAEKRGVLLLFGTGWGFVDEIFELADYTLEPIEGVAEFNHLSVRSAAAILLERLTRRYII